MLRLLEEDIQKVNEITPNPWIFINEILTFLMNNIGFVFVGFFGV